MARAFAVEYACLGALLFGVALTAVLALVVGFLATFRLLGHKPLPVLRTE